MLWRRRGHADATLAATDAGWGGYVNLSDRLPAHYRIRVGGHLDAVWSPWFDGLTITQENSTTTLAGTLVDQAVLYGLLSRLRNLGATCWQSSGWQPMVPDQWRATAQSARACLSDHSAQYRT